MLKARPRTLGLMTKWLDAPSRTNGWLDESWFIQICCSFCKHALGHWLSPYLHLRRMHLFISGKENISCCTNHSLWRLTAINLLQNQSTASESSSAQHPKSCYPVIRVAILDNTPYGRTDKPCPLPSFPQPHLYLQCLSRTYHQNHFHHHFSAAADIF